MITELLIYMLIGIIIVFIIFAIIGALLYLWDIIKTSSTLLIITLGIFLGIVLYITKSITLK